LTTSGPPPLIIYAERQERRAPCYAGIVLGWVAGGAWLGSAAGRWLSGNEGRDKLYPIKGQSPETVAKTMAKLRRKARVRVVS